MREQRGQATVELALVLPVVVFVVLLVVQVGLVVRERLLVVHAARAAARAVAVEPTLAVARSAAGDAVGSHGLEVRLGGDLGPGGLATVTVASRPSMLPLLGRVLSGVEVSERLAVRVEGR